MRTWELLRMFSNKPVTPPALELKWWLSFKGSLTVW